MDLASLEQAVGSALERASTAMSLIDEAVNSKEQSQNLRDLLIEIVNEIQTSAESTDFGGLNASAKCQQNRLSKSTAGGQSEAIRTDVIEWLMNVVDYVSDPLDESRWPGLYVSASEGETSEIEQLLSADLTIMIAEQSASQGKSEELDRALASVAIDAEGTPVNHQLMNSLAEEIQPLISMIDMPDSDIAHDDRDAHYHEVQEYVGRLLTAATSVDAVALASIFAFVDSNIEHSIDNLANPDLVELLEHTLLYISEPSSDANILAILESMESGSWSAPLSYAGAKDLARMLAVELETESPTIRTSDSFPPFPGDLVTRIATDADAAVVDAFLQEVPDHAAKLTRLIQSIVSSPDDSAAIEAAQRVAHTIKGSSGLVGLSAVTHLAHRIEDIFDLLTENDAAMSAELGDALFAAADCIETILDENVSGNHSSNDIQDVVLALDQIALPSQITSPDSNVARSLPGNSQVPSTYDIRPIDDVIRVKKLDVDRIFGLASDSSILFGRIKERTKTLREASVNLRRNDQQLQTRRIALESAIDKSNTIVSQPHNETAVLAADFDALELDEYNELYTAAHSYIEIVADSREASKDIASTLVKIDAEFDLQRRLFQELQYSLLDIRRIPVASILPRLQRVVRQAARATQKTVNLEVEGEELRVDSEILGPLVDALLHVLRNAVDHGIECSEQRVKKSKPAEGTIRLKFRSDARSLIVQCEDDGAGLNYEKIRDTAARSGIVEDATKLDNAELARLITIPGFTTRESKNHISGRGVGLDVVQSMVRDVNGSIDIGDAGPCGTRVTLVVPLSLLTQHCLLVRTSRRIFAIPSSSIAQIYPSGLFTVNSIADTKTIEISGTIYALRNLGELLNSHCNNEIEADSSSAVLVLEHEFESIAISVDDVISNQELVVKGLGEIVGNWPGVIGAATLGSGETVTVLNIVELATSFQGITRLEIQPSAGEQQLARSRVLIVDDSLSVRQSISMLLDDAGFEPYLARDGLEALSTLSNHDIDLVVTDLEMPRLNGLELAQHIRSNDKIDDVPIFMVTSRTAKKHRDEALNAGIKRIFTKPFSEDDLVDAVQDQLSMVR